jgi:hypothetical protein
MKKCMITITALLGDETSPTLVLDISPDSALVNCPKSSGIEIKALKTESHVDLFCKLPDMEEPYISTAQISKAVTDCLKLPLVRD